MTANGILQIALYFVVLLALTKPLGAFMAKVFSGERTFLHPVLRPLEVGLYKLCGDRRERRAALDPIRRRRCWLSAWSGIVFSYLLLRLQQWFPLNPQGLGNVGTDLSFNTAVSFGTNTNWQSYMPETTMSYFSQMMALATHNFWSAAAGICVAIALVRGFARHSAQTLGNFWVDFVRARFTFCCRFRWLARCCCAPRGPSRTSIRIRKSPRWKARCRRFRKARWLRRKPSR